MLFQISPRLVLVIFSLKLIDLSKPFECQIPVIIDTDIGQDFDDSWAVSVSLASPEVDIKLILTAAHNATGRAQIVAKFLQTIGRTDISIGIGLSQDNYVGPLYGWAADYNLADYPGKLYTDGIGQAINIITSSPTNVTIMAIAPTGNLQSMLQRQPSVASKVNIVAMSGSVYKCYGNASGACPEYNVYENVPAAQAVYTAGWDMTTTPLDTCGVAVINGPVYQSLLASNNSHNLLVQTLLMNYVYWHDHGGGGNPSTTSTTLYDAVAAYLTFSNRADVNIVPVKLTVTNTGVTAVSPTGKLVDAALTWTQGGMANWASTIVNRLIKYQG